MSLSKESKKAFNNALIISTIISMILLFFVCFFHPDNKEKTLDNPPSVKTLNDDDIMKIEVKESTQKLINEHIDEIKKLPKHYLGNIYSSIDTIDLFTTRDGYNLLVSKNKQLKEPEKQKEIIHAIYSEKAPEINRTIVVKRNGSNYSKNYGISLPKDFDANTLIGEPVYLYQVPRINIFRKDLRGFDNSHGEIRPEDESLKLQNIICFKDMCSIEYDLYDMH